MKIRKIMLGVGMSAVAFTLISGPAHAQDGGNSASAPNYGPSDSNDIIVTATLRSESLQEVPVAVTAFNAQSLDQAGVSDLRNFKSVAASFNLINSQNESGSTVIQIRGLGTIGNNPGFDLSVGLFLDGVSQSRAGVALGDLLDVERVELLRGPQGTLFGRNTTSGAISIVTKKPLLDRSEAFANATYGNYDLMNVQAGFSVPLVTDKLGLRLSGAWRKRDGYVRNAVGGESNSRDRYIVRGQLYFEPNDDVSFRVIGDYAKTDEKCCDAIITRDASLATDTLAIVGGEAKTPYGVNGLPNNGGAPFTGPEALKKYRSSNSGESLDRSRQWGLSATLNWIMGDAELTAITSYRDFRLETRDESDFVSLDVVSTSIDGSTATANARQNYMTAKSFTQEIRLAGTALDNRLDYLIGGYYSDEKIEQQLSQTLGEDHQAYISAILSTLGVPGVNPARNIFANGISTNGATATNLFQLSARNWSIFTNNSFAISDTVKFNFGLRYSNDKKRGSFEQLFALNPACDAARANAVLFATLPSNDPRSALAALAPAAASLTCYGAASQADNGAGSPQSFNRPFKDDALIYTGKLLWNPVPNINLYASYTHGYKSGGFNLDATAAVNGADPAFQSETVDAYEIGLKTQLLDNRLTANFALFRQDIHNFQLLEFTGSQFAAYNVPKSHTQGVEVEASVRAGRYFTFNQSLTYLDARFAKNCNNGVFNASVSTLCGQTFYNTPEWTLVTGVNWWQPVGHDLKIVLNANMRYESDRRVSPQAIFEVAAGTGTISVPGYPGGATNNYILFPNSVQDGTAKINLRASLGHIDDRWTVEFWADNVTDQRTLGSTFRPPFRGITTLPGAFNAGGRGVAVASFVQEPRTYGITVRSKF